MKLPVDRKRTIITFFIWDLIFAVLLFLSCIQIFLFREWDVIPWLIIALFIIVTGVMLFFSLRWNFYVIENKFLVVVKGKKEMYYYYTDVVYIDKQQSEKKKTLAFFTNKGHVRYLPFDKDGKIYQAMCNKCHNLLSDEEFKEKYPNVKI